MLTRRQLLQTGASLAGVAALLHGCGSDTTTDVTLLPNPSPSPGPGPSPSPSLGVPNFVQLPVESSAGGVLNVTRTARLGVNQLGGKTVFTPTYEGAIGGPTMRVKPGDVIRFKLVNNLPPNPDGNTPPSGTPNQMNVPHQQFSTNTHVHGLHVAPGGNSDNVFVQVNPGESFQYEWRLPADHPAGTFWYHPHKHGSTAQQLFGGMAGALIVEGGLDLVPEVAAARDLVYNIFEINTDSTGQVPQFVGSTTGPNAFQTANDLFAVNGLSEPVLVARSGEVFRLRVLNSTVRTVIPFGIEGHDVHLAAYDGITVPRLQTMDTVGLAPANRADVLVRAGAPGVYKILSRANTRDTNPSPERILGFLEVVGPPIAPMALPTVLPVPATLPDIQSSEITNRRTLTFAVATTGGPVPGFGRFSIDGGLFDENIVNQTVKLNAVEEWTLLNTSNTEHPFHIHINPFQVISINDVPLARPEWRDTILLPKSGPTGPGKVVIRHRFKDFTGLYVLHCHILIHEDLGMMQTVNVIP